VTPVEADIDAAHALVDAHLWGPVREQPSVQHVEYDPELRRWYVRFGCDGRDAATIYFDLHQRTLRYELYFLPSPEDEARRAELHAWLLRRNHDLYGARFSLGPDGDVYLTGRVALEHLTEQELDRLIGVLFELTERWFQPAITIAFRPRPGEAAS
jgi:Putative bacterial sensory transduction regulator